jgi:hypothetical protein
MTDADLIARYEAGLNMEGWCCPAKLSRVLAKAGKARNLYPQKARRRPAWWAEAKALHEQGIGYRRLAARFGVTRHAAGHAIRSMTA